MHISKDIPGLTGNAIAHIHVKEKGTIEHGACTQTDNKDVKQ